MSLAVFFVDIGILKWDSENMSHGLCLNFSDKLLKVPVKSGSTMLLAQLDDSCAPISASEQFWSSFGAAAACHADFQRLVLFTESDYH